MAIYRKLDIVVGQVHSQRAVEFLSRVAQLWGYRLDENVSLRECWPSVQTCTVGLDKTVDS